jgi:hypothetical protein
MKRKKFRIKKKPVEPKKSASKGKILKDRIAEGDDHVSLDVLMPMFQKAIAEDPEAFLESELSYECCYYESDRPHCTVDLCTHSETFFYQKALNEYEAKMALYNAWYEEHKDEIKEELRLRELEK